MLGIGWLPHQQSHAVDDVSNPEFNRPLVIVIQSHILESVVVPLPVSLINSNASPKLLDVIPIDECWVMQIGVSFLQHGFIVYLDTVLRDTRLDIFVLFTHRKPLVWIVL
jgi:hypothetical protein